MISHDHFSHVFERWRGYSAKLYRPIGNVGDKLIEEATLQIFKTYNIRPVNDGSEGVAFWSGGGNMGTLYLEATSRRINASELAKQQNIPFVILPQSWSGPDYGCYDFIYARETESMKFCSKAILAPDLALAYQPEFSISDHIYQTEGIFFRNDIEQTSHRSDNLGDPVNMEKSPKEYIQLAARFHTLRTNRLHFAISAMIANRNVVLHNNSYHKNHSLWKSLLGDLGCSFEIIQ